MVDDPRVVQRTFAPLFVDPGIYASSLATTSTKTGAYTAAAGQLVPCDATGGAFAVTLPAASTAGQVVVVKKLDASTNAVTVQRAGSDVINVSGTSLTLSLQYQAVTVVSSGTGVWTVQADDLSLGSLDGRFTQRANNLSDLASASTARTNLGLGGAATLAVGTTAGTVAAGDDSRITGATQKSTLTTKGDLYAASAASTPARVAVGADGTRLSADSSQTAGIKWTWGNGPVFNVKDYGAVGDNTTDDRTAIQAAIDAANTAGGGIVYFPAGNYKLASELTWKSHTRLVGAHFSDSKLLGTAGVLVWPASIINVELANLTLVGGTGHVMTGTGSPYVNRAHIHNSVFTVSANDKSILYLSGADWIGNLVENCTFNRPAGATVPGWYMTSSDAGSNCNIFRNIWCNSAGSTAAAVFYLESITSANWIYDNVFEDITGEQNAGGLIEAYSVHGLTVRRCFSWDVTPYTRDIIKVGKSATSGALASRHVIIDESGKHGGVMNGGFYEINLVPGEVASGLVMNCGHSTTPPTMNLATGTVEIHNGGDAISLGTSATIGWAGDTNARRVAAGVFGTDYDFALAAAGKGLIFGGTAATTAPSVRSGTGSPEGVVTGVVGSIWLRTNGGTNTVVYVKESGSGNTGWVAQVGTATSAQVFTASGTWTKPSWATANTVVSVTVIAGGSGGGSGRRGAAGTVRCGGGGGGASGVSVATIPASALPSSIGVTVGAGGAGGAAVSTNDTDGAAGGNGGNSYFDTYVLAGVNSTGGGGGTATAGTAGAAGGGNLGTVTAGAAASASGGAGGNAGNATGVSGGGGGGGITSGDVANNGGAGGRNLGGNNVIASGGLVDSTAPGAGYSQPANSGLPGNGGGGGAASITTAAQTGGAGGLYGAGGGGGGASLNGNNSGAGGAGGAGIVVVITRGV